MTGRDRNPEQWPLPGEVRAAPSDLGELKAENLRLAQTVLDLYRLNRQLRCWLIGIALVLLGESILNLLTR